MRKFTLAAAALAAGALSIALAGCATVETAGASADYPAYDTLEDASGAADLIVAGEYVSSKVELLYPSVVETGDETTNPQQGVATEDIDLDEMAVVTTVSELRVTEVLKGDVSVGDSIRVSQLGGTFDDVKYEEESTTLLSTIEAPSVIVFLNDLGDGTFDLINPQQGLYTKHGDRIAPVVAENSPFMISSVDEIQEAVSREN